MNLLFLCDHYFPYIGGAEIVNRAVAEYFAKKYCVSVVSKKFKGLNDKRSEINQVHIYRTADVPRVLHSAICYMGVSQYTKRKLIKYGIREDRISVIYNGMDETLFYPRPVKANLRQQIAG